MMKRLMAGLLCGALATTGCASSGMRVAQAAQPPTIDQQVLHDYVQRLPPGSRVRVEEADGRSFRGTLMRATDTAVVVQKNTRVLVAAVVPTASTALALLESMQFDLGVDIHIRP